MVRREDHVGVGRGVGHRASPSREAKRDGYEQLEEPCAQDALDISGFGFRDSGSGRCSGAGQRPLH